MDSLTTPIAVLGAGAWGTALAILLARNGQAVRLWDVDTKRLMQLQTERVFLGITLPDNLTISLQLEDAVKQVQDICLVVPSHAFYAVLTQLKSLVLPTVRFVWGTKGLDPNTNGFLHDIVHTLFSANTPVAILSGPSFAKEVVMNLPTAVSLAGNDSAFLESLSSRFCSSHFRTYINPDFIGVQLCGVVKNVIAIVVGISDGMGFGANTRCALITRGLSELSRLCVVLGGSSETAMSLAGVGDLVLTCTDNQSRNRRFGLAIGKGMSAQAALADIGESVEGYYNAKQLFHLAQKHKVIMPIAEHAYAILYKNRSPDIGELLEHDSKIE